MRSYQIRMSSKPNQTGVLKRKRKCNADTDMGDQCDETHLEETIYQVKMEADLSEPSTNQRDTGLQSHLKLGDRLKGLQMQLCSPAHTLIMWTSGLPELWNNFRWLSHQFVSLLWLIQETYIHRVKQMGSDISELDTRKSDVTLWMSRGWEQATPPFTLT